MAKTWFFYLKIVPIKNIVPYSYILHTFFLVCYCMNVCLRVNASFLLHWCGGQTKIVAKFLAQIISNFPKFTYAPLMSWCAPLCSFSKLGCRFHIFTLFYYQYVALVGNTYEHLISLSSFLSFFSLKPLLIYSVK